MRDGSESNETVTPVGRREFATTLLSLVLAGARTDRARAQAQVFAGVPVSSLLSGRIVTAPARLPSGVAAGRAVGLVDARLGELLRLLVDFPAYGPIFALRSIRVDARSHGRARLTAAGHARPTGAFRADVDVEIRGESDGTHIFDFIATSPTFDVLAARIEARRSPGGVRSMIALDLGVGLAGVRPARLTRAAAGVSTAAIARIRHELRARAAAPGNPP